MRNELQENFTRSRNTERMYATYWRQFQDWCHQAGREALPASVETLALFVVWAFETRQYRSQSVQQYLRAIRDQHRQHGLAHASSDPHIRELLRLESRKHKERPGGKKALPLPALKQMVDLCAETHPVQVRDHALLVLLFNTGMRRSELAALDLWNVQFKADGSADLYLGATKADPTGAEAPLLLTPAEHPENYAVCPVRTLRAWIKLRGDEAGPLFVGNAAQLGPQRLTVDVVYQLVKQYVEKIGLDPKLFAPHSFRAGMMTHAVQSGADFAAVMKRSRHKTPKVAMNYLNQIGAFQKDVMGL